MRQKSEVTLREAAQQALDALEDSHQNINPERGYADELARQIADAITVLRAALAEPTSQQPKQVEPAKWISIEENLPKKDQLVLGLYYKSNIRIVYRREREDIDAEWADSGSGHSLIRPTHWMPLPEYEHVHKMESNPTINEMETVEPVAWLIEAYDIYEKCTLQRLVFDKPKNMQGVKITAYYTAPPKREPLTDEEIQRLAKTVMPVSGAYGLCELATLDAEKSVKPIRNFVRAIERAHGITGGDDE